MNRIVGALNATYQFFAGDAILLTAALLAFIVAGLLAGVIHAPNPLVAVVFAGLLVAGLLTTLSREVVGRSRG